MTTHVQIHNKFFAVYEEVDMPELHTYEKTSKSEHGIVQNSREQQYQCCYRMLWGAMATIVVLIAILTSITLTVASVDFQASKDFQGKSPPLEL